MIAAVHLSPTERRVIQVIRELDACEECELSIEAIAEEMDLHEDTIRDKVRRIARRLGIVRKVTLVELAVVASARGVNDPDDE